MPFPTTPPKTDPGTILAYRDRQIAVELLAAAIVQLDFFTWLGEKADGVSTKEVCEHFGFQERPVDVMLTLFRANRYIVTKNLIHSLSPTGREHLTQDSPWYLGPYFDPLKDSPFVSDFLRILETGKPANWRSEEDGADWHDSMLSEGFARDFTALMDCRGLAFGQTLARELREDLASGKRLLDVGGGSGVYAQAFAKAQSHLHAIVLEQPPVDTIAKELIEERNLSGRIQIAAADMFTDPWPDDCDVHLMSNLLHDWDYPEIKSILRQSANAMPEGGLLIIHQAFLNDEKDGPLPAAEYSTLLMHITRGKCYSRAELIPHLEDVGFHPEKRGDTLASRGFLTARKK